jgi:2-hydroxycyclohexanecarboxyl-CoA dehydrogenase
MSRVELTGALALVTGAGSGIGASTARRLAQAGSQVAVVDLDGDTAEATAVDIIQRGGAARAYECDVADPAAVSALAGQVGDELGTVDVLVNNAGVGVAGPFLDASLADWQWIRSINLDGVVHGCQAFGPAMAAQGRGHIVNIASGAGYIANRHMAAYCATKAAVLMLSQCLRADLGAQGVGVSVICPGVINTPIPTRTRYRGTLAGKQDAAVRAFRFGHPPGAVGKAVVGAIRKDQDVVPVGLESVLAYRLLRFAPGPVQSLVTKANVL